jgi:predicted RNase H-like HicB family nuclease
MASASAEKKSERFQTIVTPISVQHLPVSRNQQENRRSICLAHVLSLWYCSKMTCKLTAIIEQDKDGAFAYCPELRGCHTQGATVEEALIHLREAAELYLETLKPAELRRLNSKTILATSLEVAHG